MVTKMNELIKNAELENVVGGSGIQCIGVLSRLKDLGFNIKTPLVAGYESEAAEELKQIITDFNNKEHSKNSRRHLMPVIYDDNRPNQYYICGYRANPRIISEDELVNYLKKYS